MKIKAAVVEKQGEALTMEELEIREPLANEVRIKIASVGVCSTDIAYQYDTFGIPVPLPMVLGHEGAGIVESVGPGVTKVKPGDHVIISNPSCGDCEACVTGQECFATMIPYYSTYVLDNTMLTTLVNNVQTITIAAV